VKNVKKRKKALKT